jgi:hypothetical protein
MMNNHTSLIIRPFPCSDHAHGPVGAGLAGFYSDKKSKELLSQERLTIKVIKILS